jgi:hypothetical protein
MTSKLALNQFTMPSNFSLKFLNDKNLQGTDFFSRFVNYPVKRPNVLSMGQRNDITTMLKTFSVSLSNTLGMSSGDRLARLQRMSGYRTSKYQTHLKTGHICIRL